MNTDRGSSSSPISLLLSPRTLHGACSRRPPSMTPPPLLPCSSYLPRGPAPPTARPLRRFPAPSRPGPVHAGDPCRPPPPALLQRSPAPPLGSPRLRSTPFLFSRVDAMEAPANDFRLRDVCAATCAGAAGIAVEVRSLDGGTRLTAVGSGVTLGNPTAAAITHVLNNRREFPAAADINDLLVMSVGTGEADRKVNSGRSCTRPPEIARIATEGVSDVVLGRSSCCDGVRTSQEHEIDDVGEDAEQREEPERRDGVEINLYNVWVQSPIL